MTRARLLKHDLHFHGGTGPQNKEFQKSAGGGAGTGAGKNEGAAAVAGTGAGRLGPLGEQGRNSLLALPALVLELPPTLLWNSPSGMPCQGAGISKLASVSGLS